jgi:hypothetical protein
VESGATEALFARAVQERTRAYLATAS